MANLGLHKPAMNLSDLFEAAKPELRALDDHMLHRRTVTRDRVLQLTGVLLRSWAPLATQLASTFLPDRAALHEAQLGRVDARAWIFYAADLAANERHTNIPRAQRIELTARVRGHDKFLFKWAVPLFGDDPSLADALRDIARGSGARDDAEDVLRLVAMYRANWAEVDGKTNVSESLLAQAESDATAQLDLLRQVARNPARQLANAAYAMWFADYDELKHLGRYLTRHEPDATTKFPGVRGPLGETRAGSNAEVESEDEELEDEAELDEAALDEAALDEAVHAESGLDEVVG